MERELKKRYTTTLITQLQNHNPIAQTPISNLQSTALVEACYFGGKIGIVCSIIETLGQERGWGDMYCGPSGFTRVQRGWRKQDDSLAALFDNGSALAMFLADGGRCDTWWPS
jgi:hypothetical protein